MKKHIIFLSLFLIGNYTFGQEEILPDYSPNTPESSALIKYIDHPVSDYTGTPNVSIPLYTIGSGDLNIPIGLSYHASGIKVNEESSWIGLGWSLQAGGVITRKIRGEDDFKGGGYYTNASLPDPPTDPSNGGNPHGYPPTYVDRVVGEFATASNNFKYPLFKNGEKKEYFDYLLGSSNSKDWISDLYYISFPGFSGKFVFDRNSNIRFIEHTAKQIKYTQGSFVVTDELGNTYTFSSKGSFYNENTSSVNEWWLTKITSPKNRSIDFVYDTGAVVYFPDIPSYTEKKAYTYTQTSIPACDNYSDSFNDPIINLNSSTRSYLQKIVFNGGEVEFIRDTSKNREDKYNTQRLSQIKVYATIGSNRTIIKDFELLNDSYFVTSGNASGYANKVQSHINYDLNTYANKRLKLTGIVEKNGNEQNRKYEFVYNTTPLPSKTSFSIDHWGYFNGKPNTTFLPEIEISYSNSHGVSVPKTIAGANRKPDIDFAKAGMLQKIIYPTKGYTEFDYELHQWPITPIVNYVKINRNVRAYKPPRSNNINLTGYSNAAANEFVVNKESLIRVRGALICSYEDCRYYPENYLPYLRVSGANLSQDIVINYKGSSANNAGEDNEYEVDDYIKLHPGTYKFELVNPVASDEFFHARVQASINWKEKTDEIESIVNTEQGAGLRVKTIKHYNDNGTPKLHREFDYRKGKLMSPYIFSKGMRCLKDGNQIADNLILVFGNSIGDLATSAQGSYVGYSEVDIYYDQQKNKGKTTYVFDNIEDKFSPHIEDDLWISGISGASNIGNGNMLSQIDFIRNEENTTYYKRKEVINTYSDKSSAMQPVWGILTSPLRIRDFDQVANPLVGDVYELTAYHIPTNTMWNRLEKTKEIKYGTNQEVLTETERNFFYDNVNHLQLTRAETITSDHKKTISKIIYPQDVATVTSLENDNLTASEFNAIKALQPKTGSNPVGQHRIAEPVQIETIVTNSQGTVLSKNTQRTNYKDWGGTLVLPEFVQTLKGKYSIVNLLQDRIEYRTYDTTGNPLQVLKTDGTPIVYIWGYQDMYPIAKIENATYTEVASYVADLKTKSNADNDRTKNYEGNEGALRQALDNLRIVLPNTMVSTYTYDPLVGITSITDSKGYTMYYKYDGFNRLKEVRDSENKLVTDYKYNYKNN
ncbi:hypothetical protein [Aquimarina macrocephali]|uniref:hypothetical protein n=1 Tax=Aquimarina macrocephali TaxID=666563 RepID=UPI00046678FD|nr:hypothetical protein [Aquimarina macrocephali]